MMLEQDYTQFFGIGIVGYLKPLFLVVRIEKRYWAKFGQISHKNYKNKAIRNTRYEPDA